ncbi:MAG: sulfatase-like hydrolase/transferase, partial [Crenarchaeota archaeon]|nr:sulfatase-like hydrolase/transferase [Thermoproteota archaeon]
YLPTLFLFLIIYLKSGASFFYKKAIIPTQSIFFNGEAYEFELKIDNFFYNPNTILVLEDKKVLTFAKPGNPVFRNPSTYNLTFLEGDRVLIEFVPNNLYNPKQNDHPFSILIRPYFFSSSVGGIGFILLSIGFFNFLKYSLSLHINKKHLLKPLALADLWVSWLDSYDHPVIIKREQIVKQALEKIVVATFFYVFMEWLFLITKPSFLDILSLGLKIKILFSTGFIVCCCMVLLILFFFIIDFLLSPFFSLKTFRIILYSFPNAFLITCLYLILLDNFSYTIFKFGIVSSKDFVRAFYAQVFVALLFLLIKKGVKSFKPDNTKRNPTFFIAIALILVSVNMTALRFKPDSSLISTIGQKPDISSKPNIILLSTDGLNASNMSAYGYKRDTSPYINKLTKTSLVGLNNFTNAATTTGSITAVLTGKTPFATHVIYPPNTLKGSDKYQHLPGLLKRLGYRTISLGVPYFVDVNTIDFQYAFDSVNCNQNEIGSTASLLYGHGIDDEIFLISIIKERIETRLKHIFFIHDMANPFTLVTEEKTHISSDAQKLLCLKYNLNDSLLSGQPIFAQIHLMGTHGSKFFPSKRMFSENIIQDENWMTDFYDDAILDFDMEVEDIVEYLKKQQMLDNTIIVVYSDHGQKYSYTETIPLLIHFPKNEYSGLVNQNTQNIDIAPTILDYLEIEKPKWMEGSSLLSELDPKRLIFAGIPIAPEGVDGAWALKTESIKPPFYEFGYLSVIQCQNNYLYNLYDLSITKSENKNHVNPCPSVSPDSQDSIHRNVSNFLTLLGYIIPSNW